jgi:hypothetical protein
MNGKIKSGLFYKTLGLVLLSLTLSKTNGQSWGCTDPMASNYDSEAFYNNGSCSYNPTLVSPASSVLLNPLIHETSGLVLWNGMLWTHNDNSDQNLYALDTVTGAIVQTVTLTGATNTDWEELAQDESYLYVGDFGNNANGNRTDLHILKILKSSISGGTPAIETIAFSYSDQTNFTPAGPNNTDFDCEAMVISPDSIFLFTKQWVSKQTTRYALPKTPGNHTAWPRETLNIGGLVTGASFNLAAGLTSLIGYTDLGSPFITLLYDQPNQHFFSGSIRKITLNLPAHQTEAIATSTGLQFFISNEAVVVPPFVNIPQQLHKIDLTALTSTNINPPVVSWNGTTSNDWFTASNWTPAAIPLSYQKVVVGPAPNPVLVTSSMGQQAICRDLKVESTGQVVVGSGNALLVRRNLQHEP